MGSQQSTTHQKASVRDSSTFMAPFQGPVYQRDTVGAHREQYLAHSYQYATSSQPKGTLEPSLVIYPANDDDIIAAIHMAKVKKVAIAIRSGGHQYLGTSSTTGENIQLDLSGVKVADQAAYPYRSYSYDANANVVRVGVGVTLDDMNRRMAQDGVFVPHGECSHVRVGGHSQTGGYGVICNQFGLMCDYIHGFDIITADGVKRTVWRNSTDHDDQELFFAVVGGSPGNLGVLTHVSLKPLYDSDYPHARGIKLAWPYSRSRLLRLLNIVQDMTDRDDTSNEYSFSVMVLGSQHFFSVFGETRDEKMIRCHPELFGENKEMMHPVAGIAVVACWANLNGRAEPFGAEQQAFFTRIRQAARGPPLLYVPGLQIGFDESRPHAISWMLQEWEWKDVREFPLPFKKSLWLTSEKDLGQKGFAEWAAERVDLIEGTLRRKSVMTGCKIAAQFMALGGRQSKFNNPPDNKTSVPWRDSVCFSALDVFYNDCGENRRLPKWNDAEGLAQKWFDENNRQGVGAAGKFSREDRRLTWAPFGDTQLDRVHRCYWPEDVYQRLLLTKRRVDPDHVFTSNAFCVGASDVITTPKTVGHIVTILPVEPCDDDPDNNSKTVLTGSDSTTCAKSCFPDDHGQLITVI